MAATSVFSGSLAAGATLADQTAVLTPPYRGVNVEISFVAAKMLTTGLYVEYAESTDGGTTYSAFKTLTQLTPSTSDTVIKTILPDDVADHVKFRVMNGDPAVAISSLSISIEQVS